MKIYKGNDKLITFKRFTKKGELITKPPLNIWFTVKKSLKNGEEVILQKTYGKDMDNGITEIQVGRWQIWIKSTDMDEIPVGEYICDIKVRDSKGMEYTILKPEKFSVLPAVTIDEDEGMMINAITVRKFRCYRGSSLRRRTGDMEFQAKAYQHEPRNYSMMVMEKEVHLSQKKKQKKQSAKN